ncbi:MAG: hypothetical protein I8H71_12980 [Xanthomonadaceae bacterium]|nr:hypothetical protein [Xanthomonadaceae bacterium]
MFMAMQHQTTPADGSSDERAASASVNNHARASPLAFSVQKLERRLRDWIADHPALAAAAGAAAGAAFTQGVLNFARHLSTAAVLDPVAKGSASASVPLLASLLAGAVRFPAIRRPAVAPAALQQEDDVVAPSFMGGARRLVYSDARQRVEKSARQHPAATVAAAAGLGFVLTLFLTRR